MNPALVSCLAPVAIYVCMYACLRFKTLFVRGYLPWRAGKQIRGTRSMISVVARDAILFTALNVTPCHFVSFTL